MKIEKILKIGCLGCLLIFGILLLLSFLMFSFSGSSDKEQQPFEIITKKGTVTLHLGMPKDSVDLIVGKPDEVQSHSVGNTIIVENGYKIKNDDIVDLTLTFEDGKLTEFTQY